MFLGFSFLSVLVGEIKLKSSRNVFTPAVWSSTQGCYVTFLMRNKPFYKLKMAVFYLIIFCIPNKHSVCFKHNYIQTAFKATKDCFASHSLPFIPTQGLIYQDPK